MAQQVNAIIDREFSFVQELVFCPPWRNPFPRCTEKILSDLRRLEVLCRRYNIDHVNVSNPQKSDSSGSVRVSTTAAARSASIRRVVDHAAITLDTDSLQLIRIRRFLCSEFIITYSENVTDCSSRLESNDMDMEAEKLILQHLESAWGTFKQGSIEAWAKKIKFVDFHELESALSKRMDTMFPRAQRVENIVHQVLPYDGEEDSCNNVNTSETKCDKILDMGEKCNSIVSIARHPDSDCSLSSEEDIVKDDQNDELTSLTLISKNESDFRSPRNLEPSNVEMTMTARLHTVETGSIWHITFGLVNHDNYNKIIVYSLSYWSLDDMPDEVTTIKWPRGGIILKEAPSFVCYSCQVPCKFCFAESPRITFQWHYRVFQDEDASGFPLENDDDQYQSIVLQSEEDSLVNQADGQSENSSLYIDCEPPLINEQKRKPFYKRLGELFPWKNDSNRKKTRLDL